MNVSKISLSNIMKFGTLDIQPGKITEISGQNGTGKSTVVEAIKLALQGGHDCTLLKHGETQGEIVIVFDDGVQLKKTITGEKSDVNLFSSDGRKIAKPQNYINALYDALALNPVAFLTANKKDRVKFLLEALPIELPKVELNTVLLDMPIILTIDDKKHPLIAINEIRDALYNERTVVNRDEKTKNHASEELKATLFNLDYEPDVITNGINARNQKITEMNLARAEVLKVIGGKEAEEIAKIKAKYDTERNNLTEKYHTKLSQLQVENSQDQQKLQQAGAVKKTKDLIMQYQGEADKLRSNSELLSKGITSIDTIKAGMLMNLPVSGLEIINGEIYRDGVHFDRLNTAQRVKIAFDLMKLRAGNLKLVCVDGLEQLDPENYEAFKAEALESGLQLIVTKVTGDDFNITTN